MSKLAEGSRFPSKFVSADGVRIHYQESGKGIPLVCIHGTSPGAFGWGDFHRNIDQFQETFRTVWFDLPQYGSSDKPILQGDRLTFTAKLINAFLNAVSEGGRNQVVMGSHKPQVERKNYRLRSVHRRGCPQCSLVPLYE